MPLIFVSFLFYFIKQLHSQALTVICIHFEGGHHILSSSLILGDKSFEKLGPCLSPSYIKYAPQQNAMYCFKLIFPPFSLGETYSILN